MPKPPIVDTASPPPQTAETWAEVRAHEHVMRYRRSGTGRAILLLHAGESPDQPPFWPELLAVLDARFRVIAPQAPTPGMNVVGWLADFLEGLGLAGVAMLAANEFCTPAIELALLDADQIARVVLVPGGSGDTAGLSGSLATATRGTTVPLLVAHRSLPAEDAVPLVMRFLDGCSPVPP
jgi:hypothetical protein